MAQIDVLEVKIVEQCNYSCVGCGSFSNLANREEYGLDEMKKDLTRMMEIIPKIRELRLYGGEPLLAKNLLDYVKVSRECMPDSKIKIITNGTLLHKKDGDFYKKLQEQKVEIMVSYYKDNHEIIDKGMEKARINNVEVNRSVINYFYVKMKKEVNEGDIQERFNTCHAMCRDAVYLDHGRLYACPYGPNFRHYDKRFGTKYENKNDGYNIHQDGANARDIVKKMRTALSACAYCDDNLAYLEWQQRRAKKSDWLFEKENDYILKDYDWYDFILEENAVEYLLLNVDSENKNVSPRVISNTELSCLSNGPIYIWLHDKSSINILEKVLKRDVLRAEIDIAGVIKTFEEVNQEIEDMDIISIDKLPKNYSIVVIYHYHGQRIKAIKDILGRLGLVIS